MIAADWIGRLQRRRPSQRVRRPVGSRGRAPAYAFEDGKPLRRGVPRRRIVRRPPPRVLAALAAMLLLLGGAWMWLRDSSLVAVDRVSVTGATGPDASQIRSALVAAARNMTTLDVRMAQLRTAVAPYPVVKTIRVTTHFPHGMTIHVIEQIPVGAVVVAGRTIAVSEDGTLLHDAGAQASLPTIPLRVPPGGRRLTDPGALAAVALLAAAPYQFLGRITLVTTVATHGLVAQVRGGPSIYFGDSSHLSAKWTAAAAVLADPESAGALYIDVTDPERPAAGAGSDSAASTGSSDATGSTGSTDATGSTSSTDATGSTGSTGSTGAAAASSTSVGAAAGTPATSSGG